VIEHRGKPGGVLDCAGPHQGIRQVDVRGHQDGTSPGVVGQLDLLLVPGNRAGLEAHQIGAHRERFVPA
jgi:hypothetical protein